ncbi:hypothetical protein [Francisella sp. TX07-6608]|uniref:hypothetical protein n=1 Tax=Francisella sp. TX07-6608 TaxID=573568 RepID=UPI0008F9D341|nr:hypothetical protein [Francisella sp. TX07-6608]OIN84794.1 hypothetical protein KX00_257 [Francisella sp. TX07-6608]
MFYNLDNVLVENIKFDKLTTLELEQFKSLFNYNSPTNIEELKFAQLYDKWFATKQTGHIANGRLQVSFILLKPDLSLGTQKVKYLHTSQIQDLKVDFDIYGFSGELLFNLPYDLAKESLWNDLFNYQNKFAIELAYQEDVDKSGKGDYQANQQNSWKIRGYIDVSKTNAIELTDQVSNISDFLTPIHYLSCRLFFTDALAFIAKQHYPVKVYPQFSYIEVFDDIFNNFTKLLSVNIDKSVTLFDNQYNWICVNCDYPKRSFYDFFFYTLRHYQLQLVYDYSNIEPSYSIVDIFAAAGDKISSKILPLGIINKIVNQIGDYNFANTNLINHHWANKDKSDLVSLNTPNTNISISRDYLKSYPVASQFQNAENFYTKEIDNNEKKLSCLSFGWSYFPSDFTVLPMSKFSLAKDYQNFLEQYKGNLVIANTKIVFVNHQKHAIFAGQTSEFSISGQSNDISEMDYKLNHSIKITTKIYPADKLALTFPEYNQNIKDLKIYGWIDDLNDSSQDSVYFVTQGDEPNSQKDISVDFVAPDKVAFLTHDHTTKELSYIVKLPIELNGSSTKPFYITLPYFVLDDHRLMPLRKGTAVAISLGQENGYIDKIMWHSIQDKIFSKDSQFNKVTFGTNDSAGIIHQAENKKLKEGSLEIFSQTSSNKTQFISDKTQMSLVYSEE